MARKWKTENVEHSLGDLLTRANDIRQKYGPSIGWDELQRLLQDRDLIPFPCEIRFDLDPLLPGEFGHPLPNGSAPEDGFVLYLHPLFATELSRVAYLVLHQLVFINDESATADDAENFGSATLGLSKEAYYQALCELSGQIGGDELL
jgi:hypothetical protein